MNRKKCFITITFIGLCILSFYGFKQYAFTVKAKHCLATQISSRIFDFNSFEVQVAPELNKNHFKVVQVQSNHTVYEHGKTKKGIVNDYGYRSFKLYYKEQPIYETGHFSYNNWQTFDYTLAITLQNDTIAPHLTVKRSALTDLFYKQVTTN